MSRKSLNNPPKMKHLMTKELPKTEAASLNIQKGWLNECHQKEAIKVLNFLKIFLKEVLLDIHWRDCYNGCRVSPSSQGKQKKS